MVNYLQLSTVLHTAGSPTIEDLRHLHSAGVSVVINLALANSPDALPQEGTLVNALGMEYIHIPVEWENPTRQNLTDFFAAMQACRERATLVHCVKNMRVSAFVYLYRLLQLGWTEENARRDLVKIWEPAGTWDDFIAEMLLEQA